jgi:putative transposase
LPGVHFHALNRAVRRERLFHESRDYDRFADLLRQASKRIPVSIVAWCVMPNHVHLVLRPDVQGALSKFMHWVFSVHAQLHRERHGTSGHVWQGRFKSFPAQQDRHLLSVIRYVERNPLRSRLVASAEDWPWSSIREREGLPGWHGLIVPAPVALPQRWIEYVNAEQAPEELANLRQSSEKGAPFGEASWARGTAERLGLESTLRPRGRPRGPGSRRGLSVKLKEKGA